MTAEFEHYQQSPEMLERLHDVPLIAVIGPSKAGKTTLMEYAREQMPELHFVVSDTSRSPRENETEGVHYYFNDPVTMYERARAGAYATVAPSITGDLYATSPDEYDQYGRPIMAVLASAIPAFRRVFPSMCTIFVLPPSLAALAERGEDRNKQAARRAEARESLTFAVNDPQTWFVVNDDLAAAKTEFLQLIQGDIPPHTEARQRQPKRLAQQLLDHLV